MNKKHLNNVTFRDKKIIKKASSTQNNVQVDLIAPEESSSVQIILPEEGMSNKKNNSNPSSSKKPTVQRASSKESSPNAIEQPQISKDLSNEIVSPPSSTSTKNIKQRAPKKSRKEELQIRS